jgi:hydrogenase maturation protease
VVDAGLTRPAHPDRSTSLAGTSAISSHRLGVPEGVELGRALDRLPDRLIAYALGYGTDRSPAVATSIPELLDAVLTDFERYDGN